MRKSLILVMIAAMMIFLASCGGSSKTDLNGHWHGEDEYGEYNLYIEDDRLICDFYGQNYKGTLSEDEKQITFDESTTVFTYEIIAEQLVLSSETEPYDYKFSKVEEEESE